MARALGVVAALVLLAAPAAGAATEPSGKLVAGSEETVLRLHDLPPGYRIGFDSECGPNTASEGVETRLDRWVVLNSPEGCFYEYQRVFEIPGAGPSPPLVEAETINTPSEAAAIRGFQLYNDLLNRFAGRGDRGTVPISPSGITARLVRHRGAEVDGEENQPGTFLFWRHGKLLAMIQVAGLKPQQNDRAALHLAQIQQGRLEAPTPYTDAEHDDTQVSLDDPGLKLPVYWVGSHYVPGMGLRPAFLLHAFTADSNEPSGAKLRLDYNGFVLATWTRPGWKRFRRSPLGKLNRKGPCAGSAAVELERGRALVYAGYVRRRQGSCPQRPPDRYWAIAHIGEVIVGVNLATCARCLDLAKGSRFNSLRGMKAVVRALELRPKPVY